MSSEEKRNHGWTLMDADEEVDALDFLQNDWQQNAAGAVATCYKCEAGMAWPVGNH